MNNHEKQAVLLYDRACGLCQRSVGFLRRWDRCQNLTYLSTESPEGADFFAKKRVSISIQESVILIRNGTLYVKSSAAIRAIALLGGGWKLAAIFLLVPPSIRDVLYDLIARNRFRFRGGKHTCLIGSDEESRPD